MSKVSLLNLSRKYAYTSLFDHFRNILYVFLKSFIFRKMFNPPPPGRFLRTDLIEGIFTVEIGFTDIKKLKYNPHNCKTNVALSFNFFSLDNFCLLFLNDPLISIVSTFLVTSYIRSARGIYVTCHYTSYIFFFITVYFKAFFVTFYIQ